MTEELKPCPFCGGGTTTVHETYMPPTMDGRSILVSVTVQHWCDRKLGVVAASINIRGRERADAVAGWNRRATPSIEPLGPDIDFG